MIDQNCTPLLVVAGNGSEPTMGGLYFDNYKKETNHFQLIKIHKPSPIQVQIRVLNFTKSNSNSPNY